MEVHQLNLTQTPQRMHKLIVKQVIYCAILMARKKGHTNYKSIAQKIPFETRYGFVWPNQHFQMKNLLETL